MLVNSVHAHTYFLLKCPIQVYESFLNGLENTYRFSSATNISYFFSPKEWKKILEQLENGRSTLLSFKMFLNNSIWVKMLFCQNQSNQRKISKNVEVPKHFHLGFLISSTETADWAPQRAHKSPPAAL